MGSDESVPVDCRVSSVSGLTADSNQCYFRCQLFWQDLQSWHIADASLEFKMNFSSGVNRARYVCDVDLDNGPADRLQNAIKAATVIVADSEGKDDKDAITIRLMQATTWNDAEQVAYLLRSCYVTESSALPALAEACRSGATDCVEVFLSSGVSPCASIPSPFIGGKNALHIACENCQEACASILVTALGCAADAYMTCGSSGLTAFDILRENDCHGMARRLEAQVKNLFCLPSLPSGTSSPDLSHSVLTLSTGCGAFAVIHPPSGYKLQVYYYKSSEYNGSAPPIFIFHGNGRDAGGLLESWIRIIGNRPWLVLAPLFSEEDFPGSERYILGNISNAATINDQSEWSIQIPDYIFNYMRDSGLTRAQGYIAFGHSAGAQFLHRQVALVSNSSRLAAIVANAGWYTIPDADETWPYGLGLDGLVLDDILPRFLSSRVILLLGGADTDRDDPVLRKTCKAMKQGVCRLDRGKYFYKCGSRMANVLDVPFGWICEVVPGVGHCQYEMGEAALKYIVDIIRNHTV